MKLRLLILFTCYIFLAGKLNAQSGTWEWIKGSSAIGVPAVYGTQGVAAAANFPDGFYEAAFWEDLQGNFWIFGGLDNNHIETSDLWMYNPTTNMWTWMKGPGVEAQPGVYGTEGVPAMANNPGARGYASHSWTDLNGDLWLMGGYTYDAGGGYEPSNDLWRYNIASNEWTWMNGSSAAGAADQYGTLHVPSATNTPGGRCEGNDDWVDASNDLWFFGGESVSDDFYNDMWRYSVSTNQWTWMAGPQGTGGLGSYGTEGVESSTNVPPCRGAYTRWEDDAGNFYLFGGIDFTTSNIYSDIWKYNTANNRWTWIAGDQTINSTGSYGTYCTDNGKTGPAARYENRTPQTTGCSHAFISFGGFAGTDDDTYNDFWIFNSTTLEWRWLSGSSTLDGTGHYGTMGVPSVNNLPPARGGSCAWLDKQGNFWLFSGMEPVTTGKYCDIWKYTPDQTCAGAALSGGITTSLSVNPICSGDSAMLTISGDSNLNIFPTAFASIIDTTHAWLFPDTTTTFIITGRSACSSADTARVTVLVNHNGSFNYALTDSNICAGNSATLTVYGISGVSIFPGTGVNWLNSSQAQLSPVDTTTYLVTSGTSVCGTRDTGRVTINVIPANPVLVAIVDTALCYETQALVTVQGLTNVQFNPSLTATWLDSIHALIGPFYFDESITVTGLNSCGASYTKTFNLTVSSNFGTLSYTLSPPSMCAGDSSLLTLSGASHGQGVPPGHITWIDSIHAWLYPDTTTQFAISAYSASCGGYVTATFTLKVLQPGAINYTITDSELCAGEDAFMYIYGANNIQISPYSYTLSYTDSVDANVELFPTTTTTYTMTATSVCGGTYTTHFTIYANPFPDYTLNNSSICQGDSTELTLTGMFDLQITPNTGLWWSDSSHVWLSPDSTTAYVLTGNSCEGLISDFLDIQVFQPGVISYNLDDSVICSGDESYITISGVINPVITPNSYLYELDSTDYYGYLYPAITTTYTVTGTSVCGGPVTTHFTVQVTPFPNPTLGSASICAGDSTTLALIGLVNAQIIPMTGVHFVNGQVAELSPDSTTEYEIIGASCDGEYDQFITVTVVTPGPLNFTVSDSELCPGDEAYITTSGATGVTLLPIGSGTMFMIDSTDYYAYLYPTVTTSYTLVGTSICTGATVTAGFTLHVGNSWGGLSFSNPVTCTGGTTVLTVPGLTDATLTPVTGVTWLNANQAQLTIDSSTTFILEGYTPCFDFFDTVFIIPVVSPSVTITANTLKFCPGDSAKLCATSGYITYNWNTGDTSTCIYTKSAGNYYVTVTDNGTCSAVSNQIVLSVFPPSPVTISVSGDTLTGYSENNYQWYLNGNPIPGATSNIYIAHTQGSYTLEIVDNNGCSAVSSPIQITGLQDIAGNSISIYPNPTNDGWHLSVDNDLLGSAVEIYNATGQLVFQSEIRNPQSEINIPNAASGVYELRIISPQISYVRKLVKM